MPGSSSTTRMVAVDGAARSAATLTGASDVCSAVLGRYTLKTVPASNVLSTDTAPPFCLTMPYTVARPSPVPLPVPFVVKNGSNTCGGTSGGMPQPVCVTDNMTYAPGAADKYRLDVPSARTTFRV